MGLTLVGLVLLLSASILATRSMADRQWQYGFNNTDWGPKHGSNPPNCSTNNSTCPRKIVVGGSNNWQFGFDYSDWALKNGPFYLNDTLVFKYDPPSDNNTHPHSVYLLPNLRSYSTCDLSRAQMIANVSDGAGEGFQFVLTKWQPHYFSCGASNGIHCNLGKMKFFVMPLLHRYGNNW